MALIERTFALLVPLLLVAGDTLRIAFTHSVTLQRMAEIFKYYASVSHQRQAGMLKRIHLSDVDVDEADAGMLKRRLRGGGEITVARANANDEVGFPCQPVGPRRTCDTDGPQGLRMIV